MLQSFSLGCWSESHPVRHSLGRPGTQTHCRFYWSLYWALLAEESKQQEQHSHPHPTPIICTCLHLCCQLSEQALCTLNPWAPDCYHPLHEKLVLNISLSVLLAGRPSPPPGSCLLLNPSAPLLLPPSCVFHVLHLALYKRSPAFISTTPLDCEHPAALFSTCACIKSNPEQTCE